MDKENQCQAITLKNSQCRNKCVESYCKIHDPKECEKREKVRRLYKEIEERSYRYLKYVEREIKKSRIRHRRWVERLEKKKMQPNVQCKALSKKGSPCKIATRSGYCHVHKHLDINSNEIETVSTMLNNPIELVPYDINSLIKELADQYYKVESRSYNGPNIDAYKLEKINNLYLEEKELVTDVYDSYISIVVNCSDIDELGNIDDFRNRIKDSINEVYEKTDELILSDNLESISLLDNEVTIFAKEVEKESHNVELRSYNGPELIPDIMKKVERAYKNEKHDKNEMYIGMLRKLSCYSDFDEIDPVDIRKEIEISLKIIAKNTNDTIKSYVDANKRAKRKIPKK